MLEKVSKLLQRFVEVEDLLGKPDTFLDQELYRKLTQDHAYLSAIKDTYDSLQKVSRQILENESLFVTEKDPEMIEIIKQEVANLRNSQAFLQKKIENLLVPPDPRDSRNVIMEIRAGTGGEEASLFVANCANMYRCYASSKGWTTETLSFTPSDMGGFKEYIMSISGQNVHRLLQHEGGIHRVQRVPETEAQGRVHTSAVTVAVLLEPLPSEEIEIDERDLQIDTYRSSGAGGQHVNKTDSAVRMTHMPSGIVVTCQEERSQHKNREKCLRFLAAKLADRAKMQQEEALSATRSAQVGSGDRSEKIRTYNFPQNRITDHRIGLTLYKLDKVMQGDLDDMTEALVSYFYQQKLSV
ncbi:MAG: peptide chain release factor 1 [Chlamydiota bacterium]